MTRDSLYNVVGLRCVISFFPVLRYLYYKPGHRIDAGNCQDRGLPITPTAGVSIMAVVLASGAYDRRCLGIE